MMRDLDMKKQIDMIKTFPEGLQIVVLHHLQEGLEHAFYSKPTAELKELYPEIDWDHETKNNYEYLGYSWYYMLITALQKELGLGDKET